MESSSSLGSSLLLQSGSSTLPLKRSGTTGQRLSMTLGFNSSVKILNSKDQTSKDNT